MANFVCNECGFIFRSDNDKATVSCFVCGHKLTKE
jgi:DNA-directed RNA polymerase subunit RPC12/RpoP